MDDPVAFVVYKAFRPEDKIPCSLMSTSRSNNRPPLLARVCRESRRVAFVTGNRLPMLDWRGAGSSGGPREADWNTGNVIDRGCWEDTSRDSAHINWTPGYDGGCVMNDCHTQVYHGTDKSMFCDSMWSDIHYGAWSDF
jgi:hypothetical protein